MCHGIASKKYGSPPFPIFSENYISKSFMKKLCTIFFSIIQQSILSRSSMVNCKYPIDIEKYTRVATVEYM